MLLNFTIRSSGLLRQSSVIPSKSLLRTIKLFPPRKPLLLDKSQFRIIYDFPYVSPVAAVLRSKTSVTTAALVSSAVLFYFGDIRSAAEVFLGGACYCGSVLVISKGGVGVVGKIYVNKEGEIKDVIISSLDSNGRRIDRLHKVEDILNIDFSSNLSQILGFSTIAIENTDIKYKINMVSCNFIDKLAFDILIGLTPNAFLNVETGSENGNVSNKKCVNEKKELPGH